MVEWSFLSNHGLVLAYISRHPRSTAREMASVIKITERTVHRILNDLQEKGYIQRIKLGRSNSYQINIKLSMMHVITSNVAVGDFLNVINQVKKE